MNFTQFHDAFDRFAESFMVGTDHDRSLIQLKIDHTKRVYQNARRMVEHIFTDDRETAEVTLLSALFHDIGRFPQYQAYKTFNDRISVDHAHLGVKILKQEGILNALPDNQKKHVLAAVSLHNKRTLPKAIPAQLLTICNIVRDSDKLDIFNVMLDHFNEGPDTDQTLTLELTPHPTNFSKPLYHKVLNKQNCLYTDMRWTNDFKLMLAGWISQLNFPVTYSLFQESGNFERLFDTLPQNEDFSHMKQVLFAVIEENMEKHLVN